MTFANGVAGISWNLVIHDLPGILAAPVNMT
jgi:hypothetical protein